MVESFEDKLIDQVRNYPHLYDVSLPLHSDKHACNNSWQQISVVLEFYVETCLQKWKQTRDRYVQARRKMMEKRSGDDADGVFCPPVMPNEEDLGSASASPTYDPGASPGPTNSASEPSPDPCSEPSPSPGPPTVQKKKRKKKKKKKKKRKKKKRKKRA
ncbi:hypothetical protein ABVT39_008474 [Epinephelus coioides]